MPGILDRVYGGPRTDPDIAFNAAQSLLLDRGLLSRQQREDYWEFNSFVAIGERTRIPYLIGGGSPLARFGGVLSCDPLFSETRCYFCVHPDAEVPKPDRMLALKLAIEGNEDHFLQRAVATPSIHSFTQLPLMAKHHKIACMARVML